MRFQTQAFRHQPPDSYGDCHRTCIANILDLDRDEVPNFGAGDVENQTAAVTEWLAQRGLRDVHVLFDKLEPMFETMDCINPDQLYILGGESRNGTGHSVVACGGRIIHDPSLDQSGIVKPMCDGFYWVTFFVPLAFTYRG